MRSASPRQAALYGRYLPTSVAVRFTASCRRNPGLGQRLRRLCGGAERQTWVERKQELRIEHYAAGVQHRRRTTRR